MSMFEVQSKNFILHIEKKALDLHWNRLYTSKQPTGLYRSIQVPVKYETANIVDLEHAPAVAHHILSVLSHQGMQEHREFFSTARACL